MSSLGNSGKTNEKQAEAILAKPQIRSSLAIFCCILWGSAFPCIKIGYELFAVETVGSQILFAGYRFFLAGGMVFISAAGFGIWTVLLKYNPVGSVAVFGFSIPIFGTLLSGLFLGEDIFTLQNLAALLFVCAGIILVNHSTENR